MPNILDHFATPYRRVRKYSRVRRKRADRRELLSRMPKNAVCAEVGVWKGDFSEDILNIKEPKELHLIDSWEMLPEITDNQYARVAHNVRGMDDIFEEVSTRFRGLDSVTIHRGLSDSVLTEFPDDYFDWMYVDADHNYEGVRKDLAIALTKVKPGGYIGGDDYTKPGVRQAVQELIDGHGVQDVLLTHQYVLRIPAA